MTDPYVDMLDAEYRELKAQLHRAAAKFEALQTQYRRESNQLADALTKKWVELQSRRQEVKNGQ
jgi:molecular chaperone GrpE (heat shock protein)